jgi:hypothetical protein
MTTGALIFAFNNDHTDYVSMAAWCARRVHQYLNIPVAVVTNTPDHPGLSVVDKIIVAEPQSGGGRYFADYQTHVTWYNAGRPDAYDLSPWDQTIVLDSDYVISSSQLQVALDVDTDFMCFRRSVDITDPDKSFLHTFGKFSMPMWWATVMIFRRSNCAQYIFDAMKMIRKNWLHYRDLYGIAEETFRNDYALSIAIGIVSGHTWHTQEIPWAMPATLPDHTITLNQCNQQDFFTVCYKNNQNQPRELGFTGIDFHAMGKQSLGDIIAQTN